jgi:hypothetical protein
MAEGLVSAEGFAVDASLIPADVNKHHSVPGNDWKHEEITEEASRATREYLATLDDAAFGAATPVAPKFVALADPAAQWTAQRKGPAFFAYSTNYLIDTDHGVIVDVEATRSVRQAEVGAAQTMLDRTEDRYGLKPGYLAADTAYGAAQNLAWLVKHKQITPHIPVLDKSTRTDGTFSRSDFTWDADADRYICPAGKELFRFRRNFTTLRTGVDADGMRRYRASQKDCGVCELKPQCCPKDLVRKVPRHVDEDARDVARVPPRLNSRSRPAVGRRSRCCSPISSASWGSDDCGRAGHPAPRTSSCSQRPRKTCGASPDCGRRCRPWRRWRHRPPMKRPPGRPRDSAPAINF